MTVELALFPPQHRPGVCLCGEGRGPYWLLPAWSAGMPQTPVPCHPECVPPPKESP